MSEVRSAEDVEQGTGKGVDATMATTEPVRRPGALPSSAVSSVKPRELTELEQQFVREAEAGHFAVLLPSDGYDYPIAMGARGTGNLFSMDVHEEPEPTDPKGAMYWLPQEEE